MQREMYTVEELMLNDSFLRYCLDEQSPDKEFWEKETELYRDQQGVFAEARYTIILLHGKLDNNEVTRQVEKIRKIIGSQEEKYSSLKNLIEPVSLRPGIKKQSPGQKPAKHFRKPYLIYGVAALALIFFGGYLVKYSGSKTIISQPKLTEASYDCGMGERKSIQLPDGSVVVLNSNSSIRLAGNVNQTARTIILKGEAFFQVAKNPAKPFIVHSGAFSVTAVGTSFYVYAGNSENDYKVDLLEGKVRLSAGENKTTATETRETMLLPGEEGTWQFPRMSFTKSLCDSVLLRKWISGRLSFKNMPVEKVFELLQQWYGLHIIIKHKKWDRLTLTGDYDNKPLDHVLKIICFSLSAGYSYSGNQVIIE